MKRYLNSKYIIYPDGKIQNEKTKRFLKPQSNGYGYLKLGLTLKGVQTQIYIHRMVCSAYNSLSEFVGAQVNHKDGDKTNNHYSNLEWVTNSENQIHAHRIGLKKNGNELWNGKFSKHDIENMKVLANQGMLRKDIAIEYDCAKSTISDILNGNRYKYI